MNDTRTNAPSIADLVAQMRALLPGIAARADETEKLRRIHPRTFAEWKEAGLLRFFVPARFCGYAMPFRHHIALPAEIGLVCGSSAWVYCVTLGHGAFAMRFPEEAQHEIWGRDPDIVVANASASPGMSIEPAPGGGYRLSGRWKFASGSEVAEWIVLRTPPHLDAQKGRRTSSRALLHKSQFTILDTWNAAGLKGTGSNDIEVTNAIIPPHRIRSEDQLGIVAPPTEKVPENPWGPVDCMPCFASSILGPLVGVARGALAHYAAITRSRSTLYGGDSISAQLPVQVRLSESAAEIDTAILLAERTTARIADAIDEGRSMIGEERVAWKRDNSFAAQLMVRGVDRLVQMMGASGQSDDNPVQRMARDIRAMATHGSLQWDMNLAPYGQWLLGQKTNDPLVDAKEFDGGLPSAAKLH